MDSGLNNLKAGFTVYGISTLTYQPRNTSCFTQHYLLFFHTSSVIKPFYINHIPQLTNMPQSPYRETVYPPIQDVDEYRRDLNMYQACEDRGERIGDCELLEFAEPLVEHCEFLEAKLEIKVSIYFLYGNEPRSMVRAADGACILPM